jgi:hypothetical protein
VSAPSRSNPATPDSDGTGGRRALRALRALLTAGAALTFTAAALVIIFGVLATSGVYGSRMAWLVGVALPLLAMTMLLSWLATRAAARVGPGPTPSPAGPGRVVDVRKMLLVAALVLIGIPVALAGALLSVYAMIFVLHGISLLL